MSDEGEERLARAVGEVMGADDQAVDPRLERLARGECAEDELRALAEEATRDPELALALDLHRPLSAALKDKVARSAPPRVRPKRWIVGVSAGVAIAAGVAMLGLDPRMYRSSAEVRAKSGDELHLSCWPPGAPKAIRCASGDRVVPGTAVMFHLRLGGDREVMMFGRDEKRSWRTYFPRTGASSARVAQDVSDFLGASLKLDATPGEENFVLLLSRRTFDAGEVRAALDDHAALPEDIESFDVHLLKQAGGAGERP